MRCPKCGKPVGTNGQCEKCLEHRVQTGAEGMDRGTAEKASQRADAFIERPPWYARFAPKTLWNRFVLLAGLAKDVFAGNYKDVPWPTVAAIGFAIAYVVSPVDLIPDVMIPVGWTDDSMVVALVFAAIEHDIKKYAKWKGKDLREYGL